VNTIRSIGTLRTAEITVGTLVDNGTGREVEKPDRISASSWMSGGLPWSAIRHN
jgi:hypothetical protein